MCVTRKCIKSIINDNSSKLLSLEEAQDKYKQQVNSTESLKSDSILERKENPKKLKNKIQVFLRSLFILKNPFEEMNKQKPSGSIKDNESNENKASIVVDTDKSEKISKETQTSTFYI